ALAVAAAIALVIVAAAELLLRVIDFSQLRIPERDEHSFKGGAAVQRDAQLGWMQIPNIVMQSRASEGGEVSVRHNSIGLRGDELGDDAPDGTIVFRGDSMVWGIDAEASDRFTDLLKRELPRHRIVNAGVLGFGTDQEYLLLQRLWPQLKPKLVVLTFSADNDRDDNSSSFVYHRTYKPYFLRAPWHDWQIRGYPLPGPKRDEL